MSVSLRSLVFLIVIHVSFSAWSLQKNPQIRMCHQLNGQYFVASSVDDEFGFCQFGSAAIGTLDLLQLKNDLQLTQATQAYKDGQTQCQLTGHVRRLQFAEGGDLSVCEFNDGSLILKSTLEAGRNSTANRELDHALNL